MHTYEIMHQQKALAESVSNNKCALRFFIYSMCLWRCIVYNASRLHYCTLLDDGGDEFITSSICRAVHVLFCFGWVSFSCLLKKDMMNAVRAKSGVGEGEGPKGLIDTGSQSVEDKRGE